jgi:WD40 repeat protein
LKEFPGHHDTIRAVLIKDDTTIVTGTGQETHMIRVWDVTSGACLYALDQHEKGIIRLEIVGNRLFSGSHDQTVRIWDLTTGTALHRLEGHVKYPYAFGFNDDNTLIAASCSTGDIKIWRIDDG